MEDRLKKQRYLCKHCGKTYTLRDNVTEYGCFISKNTKLKIADDLRGKVDGWDFKAYVLGTLFYRYLSENIADRINKQEREAGDTEFDYASLTDDDVKVNLGKLEKGDYKVKVSLKTKLMNLIYVYQLCMELMEKMVQYKDF